VCVSSGSDVNNNEGGDTSVGGGGTVGPTAPELGGPGETCGKRTDCQEGLACLSGRCSTDIATGEGGGSSGPSLGGLGETCGLTSDCQTGLQCLPDPGVRVDALGGNGVCQVVKNGLTPTGNICGAECKTAADCCELPVAVHVPYAAINNGFSGPYGTGAKSCTELAALLDGVNCATTVVPAEKVQCFAQTAYCDCAKNTWACSDAGLCEYTAACTAAASGTSTPGGCPTYTRIGRTHVTACNKAKKCAPEAVTGCKADKDCDETVVISVPEGTDTCANGKCTCEVESGLCYRSCTEDLDCPVHFTCDTKTSLCRGGNQCDTDSYCVTYNNDINSKCVAGTCESSCDNDLDCNNGRLTNSNSTRICNAKHVCEDVGCASDDECYPVGGVRVFCTKDPGSGVTGDSVVSAVTD
jgi:hypothetical protein